MSRFAIRFPHLIVVICLMTVVVGLTCLFRMPVDLFPEVKIPVVVVATFYPGMPPEQTENRRAYVHGTGQLRNPGRGLHHRGSGYNHRDFIRVDWNSLLAVNPCAVIGHQPQR